METPKLTCPYTGREMTPEYDEDTRTSGWFLSGGLDMSIPFLTKEDLYMANLARRGKPNIAQSLKCAYTGNPLTAVQRDGLWYAEGDKFCPLARQSSKPHMIWQAAHRNGKAPSFPEPEPIKVVLEDSPAAHEHFVDTTDGLSQTARDDDVDAFVDNLARR